MDIQSLMRQAQNMQQKMQEAQKNLEKTIYTGQSGGGMVAIEVTGTGVAQKIRIDNSLMKEEEKDILEDLIVAAFNNAKKQADDSSSGTLKSLTEGINLPKDFKL